MSTGVPHTHMTRVAQHQQPLSIFACFQILYTRNGQSSNPNSSSIAESRNHMLRNLSFVINAEFHEEKTPVIGACRKCTLKNCKTSTANQDLIVLAMFLHKANCSNR